MRPNVKISTESIVSVRASVSFPPMLYQAPEEIAKQKKVPLAWVVRHTAEQYLEKWPLLLRQGPSL